MHLPPPPVHHNNGGEGENEPVTEPSSPIEISVPTKKIELSKNKKLNLDEAYKVLGVRKGASLVVVEGAYDNKKAALTAEHKIDKNKSDLKFALKPYNEAFGLIKSHLMVK